MSDIQDKAPNEALSSQEENSQVDFLSMSDEDFMKQAEPTAQPVEESQGEQNINVDHIEDEKEDDGQDQVDGDGSSGVGEGDEESAGAEDGSQSDEETETSAGVGDSEESGEARKSDSSNESGSENEDIDYKSRYEALMAPFRANGKDIKVDKPEDLIRLAQMGANYNAKMHALKPNLKIVRMLENNDLLDEGKLNFLIDLSKKDPNAINKLIKDSGINPLDIDTESTEGYKPNTYTVNDKQFELDEALADLSGSPTYSETIDVISTKWDEASRRVLADNPGIIQVIDSHMQSGVFKEVSATLEREKMLGRIPQGMSDLEAYKYIGDQLYATGANSPAQTQPQPANVTSKPDTTTKTDQKRNKRKRAAGTPRSKPAKQTQVPTNVTAMSDEEFEKLMPNYL